jgi:hypothetical protein
MGRFYVVHYIIYLHLGLPYSLWLYGLSYLNKELPAY